MTLYQHQIDGARWLAEHPRSLLGDVPGLGKTRTVLEALGETNKPLVVCPAIVRTHWHRENAALGFRPLIVKSYDEIVRGGLPLMAALTLHEKIDALVLDESHYCKHSTSQRAQILLGRDGYARRVERVHLASGTPMPRNPAELWSQLVNLVPELIAGYRLREQLRWIETFCITRGSYVRGAWREKVVGTKNEGLLREILDQCMLRRTLDDVGIDVPEMWWSVLRLDITVEPALVPTEERSEVHNAIACGELAQIANEPHIARMRRRLGELKVAPVAEMLCEQLANSDEKIVVFAHHRSVLDGLEAELSRVGLLVRVDGDTSPSGRDWAIDRFQTDPKCRVFLGQNIACQTGITLTAARRVVLVEPDWSADVNYQLGQRVARIGQKADRCIGQMIALAGTLDEAIVAQNKRETEMVAKVLDKPEGSGN